MKKTTLIIAIFFAFHSLIFAQTLIPDANFEQALIDFNIDNSDPGDVIDGFVDDVEAASLMGILSIINYTNADMSLNGGRITDFTGIGAYTGITGLVVSYNDMTALDITNNTMLTTISTEGCGSLASIVSTGLTLLTEMDITFGNISDAGFDVSTNTGLQTLRVRNNALTALDLSNNTALVFVEARSNMLTDMDMRNTNNLNVTTFNADFNGGLTCIFVDDATQAYLAGWVKDTNSTFVNDEAACNLLGVDTNELITFNMYPNPSNNTVFVTSNMQSATMEVYNITGKLVLTEILSFGKNTVNISSLSSGLYLTRFSSDENTITKKLLVN